MPDRPLWFVPCAPPGRGCSWRSRAGAGKTTAMRTMARAWRDSGGHVVGLAPLAAAAAQLRDATGAPADTLAKLTWSIRHKDLPDWAKRIGRSSLVIIDEAGMADAPGRHRRDASAGAGSSEPPSKNAVTSSQSWNSTGPSASAPIRSANARCAALLEFAMAASQDSKRTTAMNSSSSVNPKVFPSQPVG